MSNCRDCGQEISFRYINGVCTPIHDAGHCDGWPVDEDAVKKAQHTKCRHCGPMVWFVRNNGGFWWFDQLGIPWPKHPCFKGQSKPVNTQSELPTQPTPIYEAYDRTARALRRCEFCGASVKLVRYASHVASQHQERKSATILENASAPK